MYAVHTVHSVLSTAKVGVDWGGRLGLLGLGFCFFETRSPYVALAALGLAIWTRLAPQGLAGKKKALIYSKIDERFFKKYFIVMTMIL